MDSSVIVSEGNTSTVGPILISTASRVSTLCMDNGQIHFPLDIVLDKELFGTRLRPFPSVMMRICY